MEQKRDFTTEKSSKEYVRFKTGLSQYYGGVHVSRDTTIGIYDVTRFLILALLYPTEYLINKTVNEMENTLIGDVYGDL